jgi:hypothetical protein
MDDVEHWGILTIGTGLGNARFTNRTTPADQELPGCRQLPTALAGCLFFLGPTRPFLGTNPA